MVEDEFDGRAEMETEAHEERRTPPATLDEAIGQLLGAIKNVTRCCSKNVPGPLQGNRKNRGPPLREMTTPKRKSSPSKEVSDAEKGNNNTTKNDGSKAARSPNRP